MIRIRKFSCSIQAKYSTNRTNKEVSHVIRIGDSVDVPVRPCLLPVRGHTRDINKGKVLQPDSSCKRVCQEHVIHSLHCRIAKHTSCIENSIALLAKLSKVSILLSKTNQLKILILSGQSSFHSDLLSELLIPPSLKKV